MDTPVKSTVLSGRRALVTDDSEAAREILRRILERAGMQVTTAGGGAEAVERLGATPGGFDVILMDLVMEKIDGIETMSRMHPILAGQRCKLIAMSASTSPEIAARCIAVGAEADILAKPFRTANVLAAINRALGAPLPTPKPGTDPDLVQVPVPSFPGCDLAGAIERCGGDTTMLHHLLADIAIAGFGQVNAARDALRRSDLGTTLKRMHNLRGDLGNLGMTDIAASLLNLEQALRKEESPSRDTPNPGAPDKTQSLEILRLREMADDQLVSIGLGLVSTVASLRRLPLFHPKPAAEAPAAAAGETHDDGQFAHLVAAMKINDAVAFTLAQRIGRRLPPPYAGEANVAFWQRFDALDFPAALGILQEEDRSAEPADTRLDGARMLVVDDAPLAVRLLCNLLEGMGHIRFALSGEQALEITSSWMPSLVISDITMGEMSGIDLCRRLKQEPRTADTPVILISADNDVSCEVQALTAGAADFLDKPLNPARVIGRVSAQLSNAARMSELASTLTGESQNTQSGFLTCTFSGAIIEINPRLSALLKHPTGEPTRRMLRDYLDAESAERWERVLGILSKTGRPLPFEVVAIAADGSRLPLRLVCRAAPGIHGRIVWVGVDDLRDRMLAERRRLDEEVSRAVATLTGGIAHEFNNLLNIAIGNLDLVLEDDDAGLRKGRIQRASEATLRAAEISRRLTESAQRAVVSTGLPSRDLEAMIDTSWPLIRNSVPRKVNVVRVRAESPLPVTIEPEGLRTTLASVLQNAWEAMPDGGTVVIQTKHEEAAAGGHQGGRFAVLEIADSGSGMLRDTWERAYDPFFTTKGPRHRGLGLTQVKGYVSRHGGSAEVSSEIGRGSVVRLRFPISGGTSRSP